MITPILPWNHAQLKCITMVRLTTNPSMECFDVQFATGMTKDGYNCIVELPFDVLPKRKPLATLQMYARHNRVDLKALGMYGALSFL